MECAYLSHSSMWQQLGLETEKSRNQNLALCLLTNELPAMDCCHLGQNVAISKGKQIAGWSRRSGWSFQVSKSSQMSRGLAMGRFCLPMRKIRQNTQAVEGVGISSVLCDGYCIGVFALDDQTNHEWERMASKNTEGRLNWL